MDSEKDNERWAAIEQVGSDACRFRGSARFRGFRGVQMVEYLNEPFEPVNPLNPVLR
jgi:hypothetical protein